MKQQACMMRRLAALRLSGAPSLPIPWVECQHSSSRSRPRLSFGVIVALVAVIGFSLRASGLAGKEDPDPTVTVLVYNNAQASAVILAGAEREAGRILGVAGVRAVWLDCLDQHSAADAQQLCHKAREPTDVVLRVLPGRTPNRFQDTLFGIAFLPTLASVYYEYAVRLAKDDDEVATILGCAIAHEVGHLLLAPNHHSIAGIMQGEWDSRQLRLALKGWLLFTFSQSKLIQAEVRRRTSAPTGPVKEHRMVNRGSTGPPKSHSTEGLAVQGCNPCAVDSVLEAR